MQLNRKPRTCGVFYFSFWGFLATLPLNNIKNLHFEYNILNLADNITYSGVMRASYTYLSDGTKLSVTDANGTGYDYLGSLTYSKSGNLRTLESTDFSRGRIVKSGNSTTPYYYIADHLGSTRVILDNSQNVLWRSDYYPYGTLHNSGNSYPITIPNRYTFSGKEEQTTGTLDLLDFGARDYDRTLCRWLQQDPLSSKYPGISQYVYCVNNPVKYVDPDGRFPVWAIVGAAVDYGFQVYNNYQKGNTGYDAWVGNVDFVDVGLSVINPMGKFKVAKTLLVEGTKAVIDITVNEGVNVNTNVEEVATKTVVNTVVDLGVGIVTDAGSKKAVQNVNKEVSTANQKLKTAERQAQRSPNSTKKAENVSNAQSNAQAARNKQVRTQMLNSTVGKAPNATQQAATTATEIIRKEYEER